MLESGQRWRKISTAILRKPVVRAEARTRPDGAFLVVMPFVHPRIYSLNHTAAALYRAIDDCRTGNDLVALLEGMFPEVRSARSWPTTSPSSSSA